MQTKEDGTFNETGFFLRSSDGDLNLTPFSTRTLNMKKNLSVISSTPYNPLIHSEHTHKEGFFNYVLNVGVVAGKWHFEAKTNCDKEIIVGWDTLDVIPCSSLVEGVGSSKYSYGYQVDAGFLQHEHEDSVKQYKVLQKGDTLGVSIDMDTNTIIFYHNGTKIVGFTNIKENSNGPFYPAVSMEAESQIEWFIQSKDFTYPIPNYKGLGDDLASKVSVIHYTNTNSPLPDSLEFQRASLQRFEKNFGPVFSEKISTRTVASFVTHLAQKINPELKGEVFTPQDMEQMRKMLAEQLKEQTMSRVIRIYELYFAESISKWKETILDPSMYPLLSSLRSRTKELTHLESEMKYFIILFAFAQKLASENPDGQPSQTPPLFTYIQEQWEEKQHEFDATKVALFKILDTSLVQAPPYEYSKIDIINLQKWRRGLAMEGDIQIKTILEVLMYVDLPIANFIEKPLNLSAPALANHLDSYLLLLKYNNLVESYKINVSQEKAVSFYQQLRKGGEERKAALSDPLNAPLILFTSGTLPERTKKFGEFLYVSYDLKHFKLNPSSKPTPNSTTTSTTKPSPISQKPQKPNFIESPSVVMVNPSPFFRYSSTYEDSHCGHCNLPLINPVFHNECEGDNLFCRTCATSLQLCPHCKSPWGESSLRNCTVKMVLNPLEKLMVVCLKCGKEVRRSVFMDHVNKECDVECPNGCNSAGFFKREELGNHWEVCENGPVVCGNEGCGVCLKRKELGEHERMCGWKVEGCLWCGELLKRLEMEKHWSFVRRFL